MEFFKEFVNCAAKIVSYGDGKIMLKTKLGLNIVNIEETGYETYPVDRDRDDVLEQNSLEGVSQTVADKLNSLAGEKFTERLRTQVKAEGTIFGARQKIYFGERAHSHYGMNRRYLNGDGIPNEQAIIKRLRETNVSQETKEARLNRLYNAIFAGDFYDNSTPLLFLLLNRVYLYRFFKRTEQYTDSFDFSYEQVKLITGHRDEDSSVICLKETVESNRNGFAVSVNDDDVYDEIIKMRYWLNDANELLTREAQNSNQIVGSMKYTWNVKVWHMYGYDDGHSKSGRNFGNVFDFVNNKFKVPEQLFTARVAKQQKIVTVNYQNLGTDVAADSYGKSKYFLNISHFTDSETLVLSDLLYGVKRTTPFLVDQDFELTEYDDKVATTSPTHYPTRDVKYDDKILINIITKLVGKHRLHEDLDAAFKAIRFWLAQPATETVESHWWLAQPRRVMLPALGLKRAAFGFLMLDEGVCTSQKAIDAVAKLSVRDDSAVVQSLCMNTLWYWGEMLTRYNKMSQGTLESAMETMEPVDIDNERRAEVMVSAMLGKKIDLPVHTLIRTEWDEPLEQNFDKIIPFGTIKFNHINDYGYKLREDNNYMLHTIPTPGATAIVVGLSGTLIGGTPLSSIFKSGNAAYIKERQGRYKAVMYNDLWAYGTYLRWQGHDIKYKYPMTDNRHVVFAANSVGIAMPPVLPPKIRTLPYIIESIERREHSWVSEVDFLPKCKTTYRWTKSPLTVQQRPEWNAPASVELIADAATITRFKGYIDETNNYIVAIEGKYGLRSSGFHIAYITPAVPLELKTEESALQGENNTVTEDTGQIEESPP